MTVTEINNKIIDIERRCYKHCDMDELEYQQAVLMGEVLQEIAAGGQPAAMLADAALGILSIRIGETHAGVSDNLNELAGGK